MKLKLLIIISVILSLISFSGCDSENLESNPKLDIDKENILSTQNNSVFRINVSANIQWTIDIDEKYQDWCKVQIFEDYFELNLEENTELDIREAEIYIKGGNIVRKITIEQLGQSPDIIIEKERFDINYKDTILKVEIVSNVECNIIIPDTIE